MADQTSNYGLHVAVPMWLPFNDSLFLTIAYTAFECSLCAGQWTPFAKVLRDNLKEK